ncbi:MAG: hypothetical protein ACYC6Y_04455 [Thermoguttaceae bacterium]
MHAQKVLFHAAVALAVACPQAPGGEPGTIDLGNRRELLVDHFLIDRLDGVDLVLNRPTDEGVVLQFDRPWEGPHCGYATMIKDGDRFMAYYRGRPTSGADGDPAEVYCLAESKDGVRWTRPQLDLFPLPGHEKTNIILAHAAPSTHNFSPMLDGRPGTPVEQRFKALGGTMESGLVAWCSPDGIHWKKLRDDAVLTRAMVPFPYMFDSQNLAFWSAAEQKYVCYFRVFKDGIRRICRTTSDDFLNWAAPVLMEYDHNGQPAPIEHLYTNQTHPYFRAPHIYVATAARFMPGRQVLTEEQAKAIHVNPDYFKDTSDAVLMTTRGGGVYQRTFLGAFIRPGIGATNWVSRTNYPALNIVQTGPAEMSVYANQDYAQPTAHLHRYSMRLDGLASARADYEGGELVTRPLTFAGSHLSINFATSAAGGIRVEIQTPDGKPAAGFALDECREQIGNEIDRIVSWKGGDDVSALAGRPVRLRFVMNDADLYALQFQK